jgi:hypothetical protein
MIKTITELFKNTWQPVTSINSIRSQSPSTGDVYHDINKSKTYVFDGSNWKELRVTGKDAEFNKKRMRKIKRLFK